MYALINYQFPIVFFFTQNTCLLKFQWSIYRGVSLNILMVEIGKILDKIRDKSGNICKKTGEKGLDLKLFFTHTSSRLHIEQQLMNDAMNEKTICNVTRVTIPTKRL